MAYDSGRKKRVMIACVTFETCKVTDPVTYYNCERVHIIHYVKESSPKKSVFAEFYDRVCEIIHEENGGAVEIVEHTGSVSDFTRMLSTVLAIIEEEQSEGECDIFVNISAGSPEYSAAAAIASMMSVNVLPFSVMSNGYSVSSDEEIRKAYYRDDKPVGLTSATWPPRKLPKYTIDKPPEHLIRGLRVLQEMNDRKMRTKSSDIIPVLKEKGIWVRDSASNRKKQSDATNFRRDYAEKWLENGWVYKDSLQSKFFLTEEGKNMINTFYVLENDSVVIELINE